jgi:uncharacterized cupredoxin-like copper-binding protein
MMGTWLWRRTLAVLSILAFVTSACATGQASPAAPSPSPAEASPSPSAAASGGTVDVTLQEWAVVPSPTSAAAGEVTFRVTNKGPEDVHEFVVLKTDLDPAALPTDATGKVGEGGTGMEVVDEIEDIEVGQSQDLTVTLAAGTHVLLCNIYDETEKEAHYQMGMRTVFEVS